jgi:hypothetical protein
MGRKSWPQVYFNLLPNVHIYQGYVNFDMMYSSHVQHCDWLLANFCGLIFIYTTTNNMLITSQKNEDAKPK